MAKQKAKEIYEANESFSIAAPDGYWMTVTKGQTFDGEHWIVQKHPHLFKVLQAHFAPDPDTAGE